MAIPKIKTVLFKIKPAGKKTPKKYKYDLYEGMEKSFIQHIKKEGAYDIFIR